MKLGHASVQGGSCAVDPRGDLRDDTLLWSAVLAVAEQVDADPEGPHSLLGLLHGLRCGGARLRWKTGMRLRLDYSPLIVSGGWSKQQLRQSWLEPAKDDIKQVFSAVEREWRHQAA